MLLKSLNIVKLIAKGLTFVTVGTFMIIASILFSWQIPSIRDAFKDMLINRINSSLNFPVTVEKMEGNLLKEIRMIGIKMDDKASIDTITVRYWAYQQGFGSVHLKMLRLVNPKIYLSKGMDNEEMWIQSILKQDSSFSEAIQEKNSTTEFLIENLRVKNGFLVYSNIDKSSTIRSEKLNLSGSLGSNNAGFFGKLSEFNTQISSPILSKPAQIELNASADSSQLSITKLVLATGNSVFNGSALVRYDSLVNLIRANVDSSTISLQSLAAFQKQSPVKDEIQVDLGFLFLKNHFEITTDLHSSSMQKGQVLIKGNIEEDLKITNVSLDVNNWDVNRWMNVESTLFINQFNAEFNGEILLNNPQLIRGNYTLQWKELEGFDFHIDTSLFEGQISDNQMNMIGEIQSANSVIALKLKVDSILDEPNIVTEISTKKLNLKDFSTQFPFETNLNGNIQLEANEVQTREKSSIYLSAFWDSSQIGPIHFKQSMQKMQMLNNLVQLHSEIKMDTSKVTLSLTTNPFEKRPKTNVFISAEHLHANELHINQVANTDLNFSMKAEVNGKQVSDWDALIQLSTSKSSIGKAHIDTAFGKIQINNDKIKTDELTIYSDFADAKISISGNYRNIKAEENRLSSTVFFKDLREFSIALFGKEIDIKGVLNTDVQVVNNQLTTSIGMEVDNVKYEQLSAEQIMLSFNSVYDEIVEYESEVNILSPKYKKVEIRDVLLKTEGKSNLSSIDGLVNLWVGLKQDKATSLSMEYQLINELENWTANGVINQGYFQSVRRNFNLVKPVNWNWKPSQFIADTLEIESNNAFLKLWATHRDSNSYTLDLSAKEIDLFAAYETIMKPTEGEALLSGRLTAGMNEDNLYFNTDIKIQPFELPYIQFDSLLWNSELENEIFSLEMNWYQKEKQVLMLSSLIPFRLGDPTTFPDEFFNRSVWLDLVIPSFSIDPYSTILDSLGYGKIFGSLKAEVKVDGTAGNPHIYSSFHADTLQLADVLIDSLRAELLFEPNEQILNGVSKVYSLNKKIADVQGHVPMHIDFKKGELKLPGPREVFEVRMHTDKFNINIFNNFFDNYKVNRIRGLLTVDAGLQGEIQNPYFDGSINLSKGNIELIREGIVLHNIELQTEFDHQAFHINRFTMKSNTGQVTMNGDVFYDKFDITDSQFTLKAKDFQLLNSRDTKAKIDADLFMSGQPMDLNLKGSVTVKKGDYYLQNFGEQSVERIDLEQSTSLNNLFGQMFSNLKSTVKIELLRDVWVRNREYPELQVELNGKVDLIKEKNQEMQLFGNLNTTRGFAKMFSKKFTLEKGDFQFIGDPANPKLNIETSYRLRNPDDISIFYDITGTVKKPEFNFRSNPSMEKQDIVSYTLFGRPFAALMGWQQGIAGQTTTSGSISDKAIGILIDRLESYATEKFGIDVIEIDNSSQATGSGTSIRAGKYINEKTFIAIVQQLGGTNPVSQVVLEYLIKKNLDLVLTQSSDESSGIDIRWKYEY